MEVPCALRTPVAALQPPPGVLPLKRSLRPHRLLGLHSPPNPAQWDPRAERPSQVSGSSRQAAVTLAGDRDAERRSGQNRWATKRNAVATRTPCCSEVPAWQPGSPAGHVLAGNAGPHAISYCQESGGPKGPGDSCPPWHPSLWVYNSNQENKTVLRPASHFPILCPSPPPGASAHLLSVSPTLPGPAPKGVSKAEAARESQI